MRYLADAVMFCAPRALWRFWQQQGAASSSCWCWYLALGGLSVVPLVASGLWLSQRGAAGSVALLLMSLGLGGLGFWLGQRQTCWQQLASTDGLTGLPNRRYFSGQLGQELRRCTRYRLPVSLLVIDLDRFKRINDRFGHPAGDHALQRVAQILRQSLRHSDVVARYAGDEFVALLPQTQAAEAMHLAQRICQRVRCSSSAPSQLRLSVSIGLAAWPLSPAAPPCVAASSAALQLFAAADAALFAAKMAGRNAVRVAATAEAKRLKGAAILFQT